MLKKIAKILLYTGAGFVMFFCILTLILRSNSVQNFLIQKATTYFSEELGTKVQIGFIDWELFDKVSLQDIYIEDQQKDTLIYASKLKLQIVIGELFRSKLVCNGITLKNGAFYLRKDSAKVLNAKFLFDAFKSDKPKKKSKMQYNVENVEISNLRFSYDEDLKPIQESGKFDANHVLVTDINSNFKLNKYRKDFADISLESFSCKEKSGVIITNLQTHFVADSSNAVLSNFRMVLPNSDIKMDTVTVDYGPKAYVNGKCKWNRAIIDFYTNNARVKLSDLAGFAPQLQRFTHTVIFSTHFHGSMENMQYRNIVADYDGKANLRGTLIWNGLPKFRESAVDLELTELETTSPKLQDMLSDMVGKPIILPKQLEKLKTVTFRGKIFGDISNLILGGTLSSKNGSVDVDAQSIFEDNYSSFKYEAQISATEFQLKNLFDKKNIIGEVTVNATASGTVKNKQYTGTITGDIPLLVINNYPYKNIQIKSDLTSNDFNAKLTLNDENLDLTFLSEMKLNNQKPFGIFYLQARNASPYNLHLIDKQPDLTTDFNITLFVDDKKSIEKNTEIDIDNLTIQNNDKSYTIPSTVIRSELVDSTGVLTVESSLLQAKLEGEYSFKDLPASFITIRNIFLPSFREDDDKVFIDDSDNNFSFFIKNINTDQLTDILGKNLLIDPDTKITGFYRDSTQDFKMHVDIPQLIARKSNFTNTVLNFHNIDKKTELTLRSMMNDSISLNVASSILSDSVKFAFSWDKPNSFTGNVVLNGKCYRDEDDKLMASITIMPTHFIIENNRWQIQKTNVLTDFEKIYIDNFQLKSKKNLLRIDGTASKTHEDSLLVSLKNIPLGPIMDLTGSKSIELDADISGEATVLGLFDKMILKINADAKKFTFNNYVWGDMKLRSNWDGDAKLLTANANVFNGNDSIVELYGKYLPNRDTLNFVGDVKGLDLRFIRKYTDSAVQDVEGTAYGKLYIFGSLKKVLLAGDIFVKNGQIGVDLLNTKYHFSDTIKIRKNGFLFEDISFDDGEKHKGIVNGKITHNHFSNLKYNFNISCHNAKVADLTADKNQSFYGKAYATGTIRISGEPGTSNFRISAKTEPNTKLFLPLNNGSSLTDNSFVRYVSKKDSIVTPSNKKDLLAKRKIKKKNTMSVTVDIEATPDADITIYPRGQGDVLKAKGSGDLRIEYNNEDNQKFKLFGTYEVEDGSYSFSLENLISRKFKIRQGGTISWSGIAQNAIVNIDALHVVQSVSLLDLLDESEMEGVSRTTQTIDCLLNLTGDLSQPTIKFDLEVPSDAEIQRRVKTIVNTDELMNREILSLLVVGKFYRPDHLQTSNSDDVGSNVASILTSTVSGQLNNWLSLISDKVNIGINAKLGSGKDLSQGGEYNVALMYQPTSRLVINGNIGYRNNFATNVSSNSAANFIGDVDIEYKITKSGKLRAKAYTHSLDNYYYDISGTAKTTQGIGLIYREDFNTLSGLMKYYGSKLKSRKDSSAKKKKKENVSTVTNNDSIITK